MVTEEVEAVTDDMAEEAICLMQSSIIILNDTQTENKLKFQKSLKKILSVSPLPERVKTLIVQSLQERKKIPCIQPLQERGKTPCVQSLQEREMTPCVLFQSVFIPDQCSQVIYSRKIKILASK